MAKRTSRPQIAFVFILRTKEEEHRVAANRPERVVVFLRVGCMPVHSRCARHMDQGRSDFVDTTEIGLGGISDDRQRLCRGPVETTGRRTYPFHRLSEGRKRPNCAAADYRLEVPAVGCQTAHLLLASKAMDNPFSGFEGIFEPRIREGDELY